MTIPTTNSPELSFPLIVDGVTHSLTVTVQSIPQLIGIDPLAHDIALVPCCSTVLAEELQSHDHTLTNLISAALSSLFHLVNNTDFKAINMATQPTASLFATTPAKKLTLKTLPYERPNGNGMGIVLGDVAIVKGVLATEGGDKVLLNKSGASNAMCQKILAEMMADMRRRKAADSSKRRIGERKSFDNVIKTITKQLQDSMLVGPEEPTSRQLDLMWKIMKGFCATASSDEEEGSGENGVGADKDTNPILDSVLEIYARIRMGKDPVNADELKAAIVAFQKYFVSKATDVKSAGQGFWALPMVVVLNEHMKFRKMTPLAFSNISATDEKVKNNEREKNSKLIWINKKTAKVETRRPVQQELRAFVKKVFKRDLGSIPTDEGAPKEGGEAPASKRPRRSLD